MRKADYYNDVESYRRWYAKLRLYTNTINARLMRIITAKQPANSMGGVTKMESNPPFITTPELLIHGRYDKSFLVF